MVSDNSKIIKYHWSSFCLLLTLGLTLLFVFIIYKMIHSNPIPGCVISSVIIGLMVYTILQCPLYIINSRKQISIKLIGKTININKDDILFIRKIVKVELNSAYRAGGSGGYFGYTGKFKSLEIGTFYMYATEFYNLQLIVTKDKKYMVSCSFDKFENDHPYK